MELGRKPEGSVEAVASANVDRVMGAEVSQDELKQQQRGSVSVLYVDE